MLQGYSVHQGEKELHSTWHAHFYSKPPARPTPHSIEDILGVSSSQVSHERKDAAKEHNVNQEIKGTVATNTQSCIRKSKQRSKCKSRSIKGTITENRESTRSKAAKTASTPKTTKKEQMTSNAKCKQTQASKMENEVEVRKRKKARTTFTGRQIWELENTFKEKKYLTSAERNELAELLNVTDCQVKIWFQNRRTKYKKLEVTTANAEHSPENGEEQRSAASSPVNAKESSITSEDSSADNEISPSKDKISPDKFCIEQLISMKNEKSNEEIIDACKDVDQGEV